MKKWILTGVAFLCLSCLGLACSNPSSSNSIPTGASNGTPVPMHGGGGGGY